MSFVVKERDAHVGVERARELDVELPAPARPASPVSTNRGPAELLLPPQARSAPKGLFERERHGSERWPTANRSSSVEETTEVHVSIGRIEVTAVHEAAPQKSGGPRRPAPMSLDQYLAKRRSGRP